MINAAERIDMVNYIKSIHKKIVKQNIKLLKELQMGLYKSSYINMAELTFKKSSMHEVILKCLK